MVEPTGVDGAARRSLLDVAAILIGAGALFIAVWSGGLWLTNDGPQHVFASFAANHIDDPALGFSRFYTSNVPLTSLGFRALFELLEPLAGWQLAYRLILVVTTELWAFSIVALARSFGRDRLFVGLVGFPTAFQLMFFVGFTPFMLATATAMFALAAWRSLGPVWLRTVVTALLLYLAARSHVVAAAVAGALLAGIVLADDREGLRPRVIQLVLIGMPALVVFIQVQRAELASQLEGQLDTSTPIFGELVDRAVRNFQPGPLWRGLGATALGLVGYLASLRGRRDEKVLGMMALLLVCISIAAPRDAFGWQLAGSRLLPLGFAGLFALVAIERMPVRLAVLTRVVIVLYAAASLGWAWSFATAHRARAEPVLAPLDELSPKPRRLAPAILDPCLGECSDGIPDHIPAFRVAQLYGVVLGGSVAMSHDENAAVHHILARPDVETIPVPASDYWRERDPAKRIELTRMLAIWLSLQEAVLVVGSREELDVFRRAGYLAEVDNGRVLLATFKGCSGRVEVEGGAGRRVQVGAWPSKTAAAGATLDAAGTARIEGVPCDGVWLLVDGVTCAAQKPGLPLLGTWTPGGDNVLRCTSTQ